MMNHTPKEPVKPDYEQWAERFAKITEEFVWIHSGSSNGNDLTIVFRDALNALTEYKKETATPKKVSLKGSMRQAYDLAVLNDLDPWAVVLRAIAERAEDLSDHISEDREIFDGIKAWLIHEANVDQ